MSSTETVIQVANGLIQNHSKNELVQMARSMGWRGDHARTPILVFALFVASKSTEDKKQPESQQRQSRDGNPDNGSKFDQGENKANSENGDGKQQEGQQPQWMQPEQDKQQESQQQPPRAEQMPSPDLRTEAQKQEHEKAQQMKADREQEQGGFEKTPQRAPEPRDGEGEDKQEQEPQQPQNRSKGEGESEDDSPQQDMGDEFDKLLKASGIANPHRLLEKAWRLSTKAKLNVMLSGPAGAGKTTLAHQLSQLLTVPFASVSCTAGMSESQLTGWLLPIGDAGKFDYVSSPFIRAIQEPSVFLLDEMDAADANVVLAMNSLLANGFLTVSHKLDNPTVMKHTDSLIIAGVNSVGGGDDVYTARTILDGSTLDRFYIMPIDYDEGYESELFNKSKRAGRKSPKWQKSTAVIDQTVSDQLKQYFFGVRRVAEKSQIRQIVSTRFAQKLLAACEAGIPIAEVKSDLLSAWTTDERAHVSKLG